MPSFIQAYKAWASANTAAPEPFHEFSALAILGAALGNRIYVEADYGRIYPSMWVALVGGSGVFKSSASDQAARLMRDAQPTALFPHSFSVEAMIDRLAGQPFGFLYWSELGAGFTALTRDYNAGAVAQLTDVWDSKTITRETKASGLVRVDHPALTILSAGKLRWFLTRAAIAHDDGFMGRWMFIVEEQGPAWRGMYSQNGHASAHYAQQQTLSDHLAMLAGVSGEVRRGDGGKVIDAYCGTLARKWDDDSDPTEFHVRAGANITKIALAIQAGQTPLILDELVPLACEQACAQWAYAFDRSRLLMERIAGHSPESEELDYVLGLIVRYGPIEHYALLRRSKMKAKRLSEDVDTLVEGNRVLIDQEATGGRPRRLYTATIGRSRPT